MHNQDQPKSIYLYKTPQRFDASGDGSANDPGMKLRRQAMLPYRSALPLYHDRASIFGISSVSSMTTAPSFNNSSGVLIRTSITRMIV